jgi:beta-galactosidase
LKAALAGSGILTLMGPRNGARDADMCTPVPLPPAFPGLDVTVARVESLRPDMPVPLAAGGAVTGYREILETDADIVETTQDGAAVMVAQGHLRYLGGWPDSHAFRRIIAQLCAQAGVETVALPDGVRTRTTGTERFWFNHDTDPHEVAGRSLPPLGIIREDLSHD